MEALSSVEGEVPLSGVVEVAALPSAVLSSVVAASVDDWMA